ncbi:MAG: hypothetical protein HC915_14650 [Anaerolineae bacterium]|nr:hypothetical protein [Anaerolineae bacterium]
MDLRRFRVLVAFIQAVWRSRAGFALILALVLLGLRLVSFDHAFFVQLRYVPNHDIYQGASFFATNMHAMRLSGDLAWWNPAEGVGYAQYPQALLSPLAPTQGHLVFMLWAQGVWLADQLGWQFAEYQQYITVTYIVLPCSTSGAFCCCAASCSANG